MVKYSTYPAYKPSNIGWLGDIPEHWEVWKVTHGFDIIGSGTTPKSDNPLFYNGCIPWVTTSELRENVITDTAQKVTKEAVNSHSALKIYSKGSLAIAMYGATIGRLGILGVDAAFNQACCVFSKPTVFDSRFVYYWLWMRRPILISLSNGGGQPNLSQDDLKKLWIPTPRIEEQEVIAKFLNFKTAQIDVLISKQKTLLDKLAEKRTALISHAVTKGLDPSVPMKDSGEVWLGSVPSHWKRGVKLNYLAAQKRNSFVNGPFGSDLLSSELTDNGIPVIYSGDVKPNRFYRKSSSYVTTEKAEQLNFCRVDPGDLLLAKVGDPPGDAAIYPSDAPSGIVTQDVVRIKLNDEIVDTQYLTFLLNSTYGRFVVRTVSVEATRGRFSLGDFKSLRFVMPPLHEQRQIVKIVVSHISPILNLEDKVIESIKKLQEYRSTLIANAVTGKIDVRDFSIPENCESQRAECA
ncbi:restriction endonuclease subunit S [Escherichia coli]